jgi:phosphate:Na+ symporter
MKKLLFDRSVWSTRRIAIAALVALAVLYFGASVSGMPLDFAADDSGGSAEGEAAETEEEPEVVPGLALRDLATPAGLKAIPGITGERLVEPLTVQVLEDGKPVSGRTVSFLLLAAPMNAEGQALSVDRATTDAEGKAATEFTAGSKKGAYVVGAFLDGSVEVEPRRFEVDVRTGTWVMFLVFGLLGGLGIFLLGMELTGDGLKEVAGDRMRGMISALTSKRILGLLIGVLVTVVLQSSSAATVLLVGFVEATMMTLAQAIGVTLGTKIGATIGVQLIAFNLADYSLILVALGFLLRVAGKGKGMKQAGVIILGFGFLFYGLGVMGTAMKPLRTVPAFTELLITFGEQPILGVLVAVVFTAIIQSAIATTGIAMALCVSGLLPLEGALPLAMGGHVGTCMTALLSSLGTSRAGKQVAVQHLLVSIVGVAIALPFNSYFVAAGRWLTAAMGSDSPAREVANSFMLFALATSFLLLPFIKPVEWLTKKLMPPAKEEPPFGPKFINDTALDVPVLALEQAHREILRLAGIGRGMLKRSMELLIEPDAEGVVEIERDDDRIDVLEHAIRPFLAKVAQQGLDPQLSAREHGFIYIVQDFEGIGDVLTKEIAPVSAKLAESKRTFSEEGVGELKQYHEKIIAKFDRMLGAVESFDRAAAEEALQLRFKERMLERKLRDAHLSRLHSEREETVETSSWHLTVLNNLRAVSEKLDNIARTILEEL